MSDETPTSSDEPGGASVADAPAPPADAPADPGGAATAADERSDTAGQAPSDPLAELHDRLDALEEAGDWQAVIDALRGALAAPPRDLAPAERAEVMFRLGAAVEVEGDKDEASRCLAEALEADPGHRRALLASGNLHFARGELEASEKAYRTLLARHRDDLDPDAAAEAYYRLAKIRIEEVGDRERARAVVEKALNAQPAHLAARRLLIDLHRAEDNWEKVVAHERRLLDFEEDPGVRFSALLSLGDTVRERVGDLDLADSYYQEAADSRPDDPEPLRRLYDLHAQAADAQAALRALARLAGLQSLTPDRRAGWYALMARRYGNELKDAESAIVCFNQALDLDGGLSDAFDECGRLYRQQEDWAGLEQHLARHLQRLGRDGPADLRARLWADLAEVYDAHLHDADRALTAAEMVVDLRRTDPAAYETVERLLEGQAGLDPARVRRFHRKFLAIAPRRVASLRALRRVELRAGRTDAAWWLCGRLALEGSLEPDEEAFLENLRRPGLPQATRPLSEDLWARHLRHPDLDPAVERLLALAAPACMAVHAKDPKKVGVKRKSRIEPGEPLLFVRALSELALIVGMPEAPAVHQVKGATGLSVAPTSPPLLLVGTDMLSGRSHRELAFAIGRALARFRPAFLAELFLPGDALADAVRRIVDILAGDVDDAASHALRKALAAEVGPDDRQGLAEVCRQIGREGARTFDAARFRSGVERTCDRLGLLLSEDLPIARAETPENRRPDLLAYAVSEDHLVLREALGIAFRLDA